MSCRLLRTLLVSRRVWSRQIPTTGAIESELHADGGCQLSEYVLALALREGSEFIGNLVTGANWVRDIPATTWHNLGQRFEAVFDKSAGYLRMSGITCPKLQIDRHENVIRLGDAHTQELQIATPLR